MFAKLVELAGIQDAQESLKGKLDNLEDKSTCMLLYIYLCEPPLYMDLHTACRRMDIRFIDSLGPFNRVMSKIFYSAEQKRTDQVLTGYHEHDPALGKRFCHPMGYFSQCFILMRGAYMKPKWIEKWRKFVGKADPYNRDQPHFITLPENTSFTKNFQNCMTFAQTPLEMNDRIPIIIFISCRN